MVCEGVLGDVQYRHSYGFVDNNFLLDCTIRRLVLKLIWHVLFVNSIDHTNARQAGALTPGGNISGCQNHNIIDVTLVKSFYINNNKKYKTSGQCGIN